MTDEQRIVCWFSCGAASAVATKLTVNTRSNVVVAYCDTGAEHEDNERFMADCEEWFGVPIHRLKSDKYDDTWSVWENRRYIAGIQGAPCTLELKVKPRLDFQRVDDIHVFGYTADANDVERAQRMRDHFFEQQVEAPLIDRGLTKSACLEMLHRAGIKPPVTYELGLPNANCLPCPKATSPAYWGLIRKHFPDKFDRMAKLSRELGARLTRLNGERAFIDEIPADHPVTGAHAPACDFLCAIAEADLGTSKAPKPTPGPATADEKPQKSGAPGWARTSNPALRRRGQA